MLKYCSDKKFDKMMSSLGIDAPSPEFDKYLEYLDWLADIAEKNILHYADWSAHNADFDAVAFPKTIKYLGYPTYWGNDTVAEIPAGATWLDIWKICDKLVYDSDGIDHRFIETFDIDGGTVRVFFGS